MPTRISKLTIGVAAAFLVAGVACAQERRQVPPFRVFGAPESQADAQALEGLIDRFKTAWSEEDTNALIDLHTDDTEWINAYARMFRGTDALARFLEHKLFPEFADKIAAQEAANMTLISIRYIGEAAAVVHMYTDGSRGPSRNAGEKLRRTHLHLVLDQRSGDWKIAHTAIMDAR